MTGADLIRWRAVMGLNKVEGAKALGLSRNTLQRYEVEGAPRYIALACAALVRGIAPWPQ